MGEAIEKKLAIFYPDKKKGVYTEKIGEGICIYIGRHPGRLKRRRELRRCAALAAGCVSLGGETAKEIGLPILEGNGERLLYSLFDRLVPEAEHVVLSVGAQFVPEAIIRLVRRVRFPEIICPAPGRLGEYIEAETGAAVPIFTDTAAVTGKVLVLLPGGAVPAGVAEKKLDLTETENVIFLPPPVLRGAAARLGTDADTVEGLIRFFGISCQDVQIFCRNNQKKL